MHTHTINDWYQTQKQRKEERTDVIQYVYLWEIQFNFNPLTETTYHDREKCCLLYAIKSITFDLFH